MEMHSVKHAVVIQPGSKSGRDPTGKVIGNKAFPTKQAVWKGEEWAYFKDAVLRQNETAFKGHFR